MDLPAGLARKVTKAPFNLPVGEGPGIGLAAAFSAYLMWGFAPLYYKLIDTVPAVETIAHRIIWTVILLALALVLARRMGEVTAILKSPKLFLALCLSGALIAANWTIFIHAINIERTVEVSLGYFTLPLINVAMGVVILKERLRPLQGLAILLAAAGVGQEMIRLGTLPWIALSLAALFAGYGYIRKVTAVGAAPGLFVETLILLPVAVAALVWFAGHGGATPDASLSEWLLLAGTGVVTGVPLILFATGARRLSLTVIGLLQYVAPTIQFCLGAFLFGEPVADARVLTLALVWVGLVLFTYDQVKTMRRKAPAANPQ